VIAPVAPGAVVVTVVDVDCADAVAPATMPRTALVTRRAYLMKFSS
jgi:hypothetical protein